MRSVGSEGRREEGEEEESEKQDSLKAWPGHRTQKDFQDPSVIEATLMIFNVLACVCLLRINSESTYSFLDVFPYALARDLDIVQENAPSDSKWR